MSMSAFCLGLAAFAAVLHVGAGLSTPVLDKPRWTGESWLSAATNAVIATKPIYELLKVGARRVLIRSAESKGVAWRAESARLLERVEELEERRQSVTDPALTYPSYYLSAFHAYPEGNLNWLAATECESATYSMANRVWPKEGLSSEVAQERLRSCANSATKEYIAANGGTPPKDILEAGCSVGISTSYLSDAFPDACVTALDLSPHFLAVAQLREEERRQTPANSAEISGRSPVGIFQEAWRRKSAATRRPVRWLHANMEETRLESCSFDLVAFPFLVHELPSAAIRNCLREAHRLLRPNGVLSVTEMDPASEIIQKLPPPIFTMMKSTEPFADQYYTFKLLDEMAAAGFDGSVKVANGDPRHSHWLGLKK